jgi:DNA-binding response OmpR family regulator
MNKTMKKNDTVIRERDVNEKMPAPAGLEEGNFLLADCSQTRAVQLRQAFREAGIVKPLQVVPDGEQVIDYLRGGGFYNNRAQYPMPDAVLLDLNLPRKNGFEVLGWIRAQSDLKSLIVVMLTDSNRSADADRAHEMGADFYLTKPERFDELVKMTRCLNAWLGSNYSS